MLFLRKLFKLPSPLELGWSSSDALPCRDFTPDCEGPTWEDWHVEVKKLHPVKYWIAETAGDAVRRTWYRFTRPFTDFHYWLVSHVVPRRRHHILDLRQPKNKHIDSYQYGYVDTDSKMLFALFNLLNRFVEKELDSFYCPSEEEVIKDPYLQTQRDHYFEIKNIHYWWNVERKEDAKLQDQMQHEWWLAKKNRSADYEDKWNLLTEAKQKFDDKEDEMIARLMKIRRTLWT
jgi:hypothetical protein